MRFTSFRRLGTASLAAAACVLAAPAASLASNADIGPGAVLRYTGSPTEANHLEISFDWMRGYVLSDTAVTSIALGPAAQRSHPAGWTGDSDLSSWARSPSRRQRSLSR